VRVFSSACGSASRHLICVNMAAFQFYLQWGETEKNHRKPSQASGAVGGDRHVVFVKKKFTGEKKAGQCVAVMQQPVFFFFCCQSSGRNLRTFSHSRYKTAHNMSWPARTNSL
jgi:hypothetical protein